ncbi:MAG: GNAT family N-acetyltransferase [Roseiflexaceae bacterium]|nr:GNAT family N-acetyltransferase [Roseiflexaceae bacterium]
MSIVVDQLQASPEAQIEVRPARMADIYTILGLHSEAFADKFGAAFGPRGTERGIEAMAEAWRRQGSGALRGMLVATAGGEVIGTTTLRTWEMGVDDSSAAEMAFQRVLGVWGAFRSIFALSLLDHQIARDEGYITDVAVHSQHRRRGVARALLARAEAEARDRRKRTLGLYVAASNRGARILYRQLGFADVRMRHSFMTALLLKRWGWVYMRKLL